MILVILFKVAVSQLSAALKSPTPDVAHSSLGCFPIDQVTYVPVMGSRQL